MSKDINHKHRFNIWAKNYDKSLLQRIFFDPTHTRMLKEIYPLIKEKFKALDVACGTGRFCAKLDVLCFEKMYGWAYYIDGIDNAEIMIEEAKAKTKGIEWKVGDASRLPYTDNSFDVVTCSHAFHHFEHQLLALQEMYRVTKKGGQIIICDGYKYGLIGWLVFTVIDWIEQNIYHNSAKEMRTMCFKVGFKRVIHKRFNLFAPNLMTIGIK